MTAQPVDQSDPTLRLPRDLYYVAIHRLRDALPPPLTDSPEDILRRDNAAIAEIASMLPANANEAVLAATCVAANACAMHALAEARAFAAAGDRIWQQKCTAQSLGMMREARGTRTLLLRLQSAREQREKDATACDRAAWNEHCVINLMRQGLADAEPGANPNHGATPPAPSSDPPPPVSAPAEPARGRQIHRFATVPADVPSAPPRPVAGPAVLDRIAPRPSALDSA